MARTIENNLDKFEGCGAQEGPRRMKRGSGVWKELPIKAAQKLLPNLIQVGWNNWGSAVNNPVEALFKTKSGLWVERYLEFGWLERYFIEIRN